MKLSKKERLLSQPDTRRFVLTDLIQLSDAQRITLALRVAIKENSESELTNLT